MGGRAAVDGAMSAVAAVLLLWPPVSDRIGWLPWALAALFGAALGVVAAAVARPPSGGRGWVALGLALVPALGLASADAAAGFCCLIAHLAGVRAGRACLGPARSQ